MIDKKQALGMTVVGIFLAILIAVIFWPRAEAPDEVEETPSTISATISPITPTPSDPLATPTPTPTASLGTDADTDSSHDHSTPGQHDESVTADAHLAEASAALTAYMTFSSDESVEARAARLAPYFAAGSPYLTTPPKMANPNEYVNVTAQIAPTGTAVAGVESEMDDSFGFMIVVPYTASYVVSGQPIQVVRTDTWHVTAARTYDGLLLSVIEPDYIR